jgi:hypothetical protein
MQAHCFIVLAAALLGFSGMAAEPAIYKIELFSTNQVLLHFDTDRNRKYELQYIDRLTFTTNAISAKQRLLSSDALPAGWSNVFVVPPIPFPNHYIVVDFRTNAHRFYRLRVTP